ncbi:hypothetical protein [Rhodococcus sp. PSBB049]|nr:hypothetical protein [Rhodococcus sp. PSBB049]
MVRSEVEPRGGGLDHDPASAEVGSVRNHGPGLLAPASPAAEQLTLL